MIGLLTFILYEQTMELKPACMTVTTISGLYDKDVPGGYFLPECPSTFQKNAPSLNDEMYHIHDFPPSSVNTISYLRPIKVCPVVGNKLPVLLRRLPSVPLQEHWRKWVPHYQEPDYRVFSQEDTGDAPLVTLFPHQNLRPEQHAVNPEVHYKLLSKETIPKLGVPCPKHLSLEDFSLPCMIKATHGLSGQGTFIARNQSEADAIMRQLTREIGYGKAVVTEVISDLTGDYCVEFYLQKSGEIHWIGVSRQIIGESFSWDGGIVDIKEQDKLKKLFIDSMEKVKEYLHKYGYFGLVGVDILTNKNGQYVNDLNPRLKGATPVLLFSPLMAERGLSVGVIQKKCEFLCDVKSFVSLVDDINAKGEVNVIILSLDSSDRGCVGYITVFAKTEMEAKQTREQLLAKSAPSKHRS